LDLQRLFRAEVGEKPALRQREPLRQGTDGQTFQARLACEPDGVVQNRLSRRSAFRTHEEKK
jgi:hypothetical protein